MAAMAGNSKLIPHALQYPRVLHAAFTFVAAIGIHQGPLNAIALD
jgi:hypothetical protein